jgi:hypothetical protein
VDQALIDQAKRRAAGSATGIGASFDRDITPPDLDGHRWRLIVSDGVDAGQLAAELSRSQSIAESSIPVLTLMRVVERRAGGFPRESRLEDLLAAERLVLRSDHFRDRDFEPGASWLD